jgi:hypothetical protein
VPARTLEFKLVVRLQENVLGGLVTETIWE